MSPITVREMLETYNTLVDLSTGAGAEASEALTPEEKTGIETLEILTGRMSIALAQRMSSLARVASSTGIVVPRGDTTIAPDGTVGNRDSGSEYFETPEFWDRFRDNQEQSDADFKEKQRIIKVFNENIFKIISSHNNSGNRSIKRSTKKLVTNMLRQLSVDRVYTNSDYMKTLFDLIFNIENTEIRNYILSEIRGIIKKQFVERDGSINQEYLPAAMSILALAADDLDAQSPVLDTENNKSIDTNRELLKFAEELIDASFVQASQAKPDFTLKHYAEFFIAVASILDKTTQRRVLETFQKYFTESCDYAFNIQMVLSFGINCDTNFYAIETMVKEVMILIELSDNSARLNQMLPTAIPPNTAKFKGAQSRYAIMSLDYFKSQGLGDSDPRNLSQELASFQNAREEFAQGFNAVQQHFEKYMIQLESSMSKDNAIDVYSTIARAIKEKRDVPLANFVDLMSAKYPAYKGWFENHINIEDNPYMKRYRALTPGRTSLANARLLLKTLGFALPSEVATEIESKYEIYREGLCITCIGINDSIQITKLVNMLPNEVLEEAVKELNELGGNTSPKVFMEHKGIHYYFRLATETDRQTVSELDQMADLSSQFVPDIAGIPEDEIKLAIKNKQISTRTTANRYVSERGFQVKVKVADKTCEITMKRKADEGYVAGVLSIDGYAKVPFIFDNNTVLHLPSSQNSSFTNEITVFLTNVFYQYSCSEVLSPEDSSHTDLRKQFYQIVPHLTYLPVNKKYTPEARNSFLEEQGLDLESVSRARRIIDPEHRNTTYNRGAERDATSTGPVRISIKRELLSELELKKDKK